MGRSPVSKLGAARWAVLWLGLAVPLGLGPRALRATTAGEVGGCGTAAPERTLDADPTSYLALLGTLQPGDLLRLAAGTYTGGLPLIDLHGEPDRCIVVEGPSSPLGGGANAIFLGRDCCNTIQLVDSSYLKIRSLELDGDGRLGDAVKAESTATSVHHVVIEDLWIHDHDADQQIVGINTKCPTWNWVLRRNVIESAGTGIYLGDSTGLASFVAGLIEENLVTSTLGYNLQIKHQLQRDTGIGQPTAGSTIVRHNVFSKASGAAGGGDARPNVLFGHWPLSGAGATDEYRVYGNFFYQNPTEALLQSEGNLLLYGNLFVNAAASPGTGVNVQPHNDLPRKIRLVQNTVVVAERGLTVTGGDPAFEQIVLGNAVFAAVPLAGGQQIDNVVDAYAAASSYLARPFGQISGGADRLDLYPLVGSLSASPLDLLDLVGEEDADRDFNLYLRSGLFRGAYSGEGANPGWTLALERKPVAPASIFADGFESGDPSRWSSVAP